MFIKLFNEFWLIYKLIKSNEMNKDEIKLRTQQWKKIFIQVFKKDEITPYIHCFCDHLFQFVEIYGDINLYNQQGI